MADLLGPVAGPVVAQEVVLDPDEVNLPLIRSVGSNFRAAYDTFGRRGWIPNVDAAMEGKSLACEQMYQFYAAIAKGASTTVFDPDEPGPWNEGGVRASSSLARRGGASGPGPGARKRQRAGAGDDDDDGGPGPVWGAQGPSRAMASVDRVLGQLETARGDLRTVTADVTGKLDWAFGASRYLDNVVAGAGIGAGAGAGAGPDPAPARMASAQFATTTAQLTDVTARISLLIESLRTETAAAFASVGTGGGGSGGAGAGAGAGAGGGDAGDGGFDGQGGTLMSRERRERFPMMIPVNASIRSALLNVETDIQNKSGTVWESARLVQGNLSNMSLPFGRLLTSVAVQQAVINLCCAAMAVVNRNGTSGLYFARQVDIDRGGGPTFILKDELARAIVTSTFR